MVQNNKRNKATRVYGDAETKENRPERDSRGRAAQAGSSRHTSDGRFVSVVGFDLLIVAVGLAEPHANLLAVSLLGCDRGGH